MTLITEPRTPSELNNTLLTVTGPLGKLTLPIKPFVKIGLTPAPKDDPNAENILQVSVENDEEKQQRAMWRTTRALINNAIIGVSDGYKVYLRLVGVDYRGVLENNNTVLSLKLSYSHPIQMELPEGVTFPVPAPNRIVLISNIFRFFRANKKSSTSPLKLDYTNYYRACDKNTAKLDLFVIEIKAPGRNRSRGDFHKTGFLMGNMVDALVKTVDKPLVSGLLVDGYKCFGYVATSVSPDIYLKKEVFEIDLPQGRASISCIFNIISCIMGLRNALTTTINQLKEKISFDEVAASGWIRKGFPYGKKEN